MNRLVLLLLLCLASLTAAAAEPIPIAVISATNEGAETVRVIEADLLRSGDFRALPQSPLGPDGEPTAETFAALRLAGVQFLIHGRATANDLRFSVSDIRSSRKLLEHRFATQGTSSGRRMAHMASDMITERLLGRPGIANTKIAYVAASGYGPARRFQLIMSDSDGESVQVIAKSHEPMLSPAWSPDRRSLAFVGYTRGQASILIYELAERRIRTVVSERGINSSPTWSPDGRQLAFCLSFENNPDIYIQDLQTNERSRLTDHYGIDTEPSWSPDGQSIAFTSDRMGKPRVFVVSVAGGEPRPLPVSSQQAVHPQYSPDGKSMAMVTTDQGIWRISLLNLENGQLRHLTDGPADNGPSFSPNGRFVVYATQSSTGGSELAQVSVDGRTRIQLSQPSDAREPTWSSYLR